MKKFVHILQDILLFIPAVLAWLIMLLISFVHGIVDGLK